MLKAMGIRATLTGTPRARPLRLAAIWLALAVALLSSVMSSGLPRTTAFGSAFNPATTAVALQPSRATPRVQLEQVRRDDDLAGGRNAVIALPISFLQPAARATDPAMVAMAAAAAHPTAPPAGLAGTPRGPPLT